MERPERRSEEQKNVAANQNPQSVFSRWSAGLWQELWKPGIPSGSAYCAQSRKSTGLGWVRAGIPGWLSSGCSLWVCRVPSARVGPRGRGEPVQQALSVWDQHLNPARRCFEPERLADKSLCCSWAGNAIFYPLQKTQMLVVWNVRL